MRIGLLDAHAFLLGNLFAIILEVKAAISGRTVAIVRTFSSSVRFCCHYAGKTVWITRGMHCR